ncbi:Hypothetical predicted protein, partial [Podarcis lilfordi]
MPNAHQTTRRPPDYSPAKRHSWMLAFCTAQESSVHRITGCLCVNKANDASDAQTYVGTSHCDRTFPAPTNMPESETGTFSGSKLTACLARLLTISAH